MRMCCIVVLIVASVTPALAQAPERQRQTLIISDRAMAIGLEKAPPAAQSRDSLKNAGIDAMLIRDSRRFPPLR